MMCSDSSALGNCERVLMETAPETFLWGFAVCNILVLFGIS